MSSGLCGGLTGNQDIPPVPLGAMMRVGIFDYMDCAHSLPGIDKGEVHGHTYKVEVVVQGEFKGKMLIDFKSLRESARQAMSHFDHKNANDVLNYPSTENICLAIFETLKV